MRLISYRKRTELHLFYILDKLKSSSTTQPKPMHKKAHKKLTSFLAYAASLGILQANPSDLDFSRFTDSTLTPSPACLGVHANGDVFVGVDLLGSLGKGPDKGSIVRLRDTNNDGKADEHTVFAKIDHPRGIIAMGDKVYALHADYAGTMPMKGMYLSVLEDKDGDGVADGQPKHLIKDVSTIKFNRDRGADHTTNGIRMGIDGWIYIAVGDFGFVDAVGSDGTKLTQLGGGILRVRPDGSEMETYTYGLRNIYDVAIDPFMNVYTRGNTNDGVGWWIRFIDQIQSGDYGYPSHYMYFTDETIPALCDLGRGSGTGALFMDEPTWPAKYNKQPMMVDWGLNHIYIHRLTQDGPTFTQKVEDFIGASQPTDLDVDGSGRMYIAAWQGAGYKGNPNKGYVERVVPAGWKYKPFPELSKLTPDTLVKGISSASATTRLATQQEILQRGAQIKPTKVLSIAQDSTASLETRVAAIFTYAQMTGDKGVSELLKLTEDKAVREFALRAIADRKPVAQKSPLSPFLKGLKSDDTRVQVASLVGLARIGKAEAAGEVVKLAVTEPRKFSAPTLGKPLFKSKKLAVKETVEINVKLDGKSSSLFLISDKAGDSGNDHTSWFNPKITVNGKVHELKKWKKSKQGWGKTALNKSCSGKPLKRMDGKPFDFGIGSHADSIIEFKIPEAFMSGTFTATAGFADTAAESPSAKFIVTQFSPSDSGRKKGPHATPNSKIIVPHIAVQTLRALNGVDASLAAIDSSAQDGAIWALRRMHDSKGVDGLIAKLHSTNDQSLKVKLMDALARLYSKEAPYDGSWWWGTRPDPAGPYYKPITWSASEKIAAAYIAEMTNSDAEHKDLYTTIAKNNKAFIPGLNDIAAGDKGPKIPKVGELSIEDAILAFEKYKPNLSNGKQTLKNQACIGCHSIENAHPKKGPDLDRIGATLEKLAIAEAILKPEATIAENWVDATMKNGTVHNGTLVKKDTSTVIVRNIAGIETKLDAKEVNSVKRATSTIMAPHLVDNLTIQQFVDIVSYLASKK
jgi:putative heme-binding domain-containing protein